MCGGGQSSFVYLKCEIPKLSIEEAFKKFIPALKGEIGSGSHWHMCIIKKRAALKTQNLTKAGNWSTG